jgi:tripartite-type tricarboxylate transporter receptor subunit TctC
MKLNRRLVLGLAAAVLPLASFGQGDAYPDRAVKIVVPYPAGGYYDRVARILSDVLKTSLKQSVIVENKVGANGVIGADLVAKSPPDGYTLLLAGIGPNAISPALSANVPYDPVKDFAPIALLVSAPNVLVVPAASKVHTLPELVAATKSMNGRANYAHNGIGSSVHLAMELLKGSTGLQINPIPYKGSSFAVTAVTAGEVDVAFGSVLDVLPLVQGGKLRAVAIGGTERIAAIPNVKTVAEQGITGFDSSAWSGLMAPHGTPRAVVDKLNAAVNAALKDPAVVKRLSPGGELQMLGGTPERFGGYVKTEIAKWQKVVRDNAIKAE